MGLIEALVRGGDLLEHCLRGRVRLVLQLDHVPAGVDLANHAAEAHHRARAAMSHGRLVRGDVQRLGRHPDEPQLHPAAHECSGIPPPGR